MREMWRLRVMMGVVVLWAGVPTASAELPLPEAERAPDTREAMPPPEDFLELPRRDAPSPSQGVTAPASVEDQRAPRTPPEVERLHRSLSPEREIPRSLTGLHEHEAPETWEAQGVVTIDALNNAAGGVSTGLETVSLAEFVGVLRTDAWGWRGMEVAVHLAHALGDSPSRRVGDVSAVSGIDAGGANGFFVWDAWVQQALPWWGGRLRVGVVDFNNDFYVSDYANLFLNGSFGMGSELGGEGGVHTYPATGTGVQGFVEPGGGGYLNLGYWFGRPSVEGVLRNGGGGDFFAGELGWRRGVSGEAGYVKLGLGWWRDMERLTHWAGEDWRAAGRSGPAFSAAPKVGNSGGYLVGEVAVGRRLGLFFKAGRADPARNRYAASFAFGVHWSGVLPGHQEDALGLAVLQTRQSQEFLDYAAGEGVGYFRAESVYELTYSTRVGRYWFLQPDFQYVLQPGMDPNIGNALVVGLRLQALW